MSARGRAIAWVLGGGAALLVLALVIGRMALLHYVQGDAFRAEVARNIGHSLQAESELGPLTYRGGTFSTSAFTARGFDSSAFSKMEIEPIRADLRFGRVLEGVWQVDHVEAEQATLDFSGPRLPAPARTPSTAGREVSKGSSWWPSRVEVQSITLHRGEVRWDGGKVRQVALEAQREGDEWALRGTGGVMEQTGYPQVTIDSFRLRQRGTRLTIEKADLRQGLSGTASVEGEVRFNEALEMRARLDRIPIEPLLAADWKKRLTGNLNGTIAVASPLPAQGAPELSGSLTLTDGKLEALPVLNELATFTQLAQFRTLTLSRVQGDFRRRGERLEVTKLIAESAGTLRIEGGFIVEAGRIRGDFQVGLTPASVQWLPGARTKLFATARDGYCWAPMHLEGPVESPSEDLSSRLAAAVTQGTIETVKKFGEDLPVKVPEAAKKLFDTLLGR